MDRRSAEALTGYRACLRPFCLSLNLGVPDAARPPSGAGGRYWDRTSDLFGVKQLARRDDHVVPLTDLLKHVPVSPSKSTNVRGDCHSVRHSHHRLDRGLVRGGPRVREETVDDFDEVAAGDVSGG